MGEKLDTGREWGRGRKLEKSNQILEGGVKQKNPNRIFDQHVNAKHLTGTHPFLSKDHSALCIYVCIRSAAPE